MYVKISQVNRLAKLKVNVSYLYRKDPRLSSQGLATLAYPNFSMHIWQSNIAFSSQLCDMQQGKVLAGRLQSLGLW